jgi:N-acetyl-anhydromuramyl-L-alanine amidase AmpD
MGRYVPAAPDAIRTRKPGVRVDRIIIHTMQGTLAGSIAWFQTPGRSVPTAAHYLIGNDGDIVQMVPDANKALHAGSKTEPNWNDRSLAIEHAGYVDDGKPPPAAMLAASAKVCAVLLHKFGLPADRVHVIGHSEVPGATHTDPGSEWPWDRYMALVRASLAKLA